jgi:hypothetical protein
VGGSESNNPIGNVVDKAKNALPDLSELPSPVPSDTANRDNRNLGPNEIGKGLLKNLPNASPIDSATPGTHEGYTSSPTPSLPTYGVLPPDRGKRTIDMDVSMKV